MVTRGVSPRFTSSIAFGLNMVCISRFMLQAGFADQALKRTFGMGETVDVTESIAHEGQKRAF